MIWIGLASSGSAANRFTSNPGATMNDLRSISGSGSGTLASRWAYREGTPARRESSARVATSGDLFMEIPVRERRAERGRGTASGIAMIIRAAGTMADAHHTVVTQRDACKVASQLSSGTPRSSAVPAIKRSCNSGISSIRLAASTTCSAKG